jgi:hypothetical protein
MKAICYSEDFICTSSPSIPFEQRKAVVWNRATGRLVVIDMTKNVLLDVFEEVEDCRTLLYK